MKTFFRKLYLFFISLKLAVFNLSSIAFLTALGTFIESRWDQEAANKWIYYSWWMYVILFLLSVNVFTVLVDRWPWKKHQVGFVLAHLGILTMVLGSLMTRYLGIEGSLRFKEGEEVHSFLLPETEVAVYSSYDGEKFRLLYQKDVDFFLNRPTKKTPFIFSIDSDPFILDSYIPYGIPRVDYEESKKGKLSSVRFYLEGSQGKFVEWMELPQSEQTVKRSLGPAQITLTKNRSLLPSRRTELVLYVQKNKLFYALKGRIKKRITSGQTFKTGWMDFKFRLLQFYPKSRKVFIFSPQSRPNDNTLPSVRVSYKKNEARLGLNSFVRFYDSRRVYAIGYLHKKKPLNFSLKLLDFKMTPYQGSQKAKTYESKVRFSQKEIIISMNEPLKLNGYTFYQSSYELDEEGQPTISILSINRDPGRFVKYAGSLLLVLGVLLLFFRKKIKVFLSWLKKFKLNQK